MRHLQKSGFIGGLDFSPSVGSDDMDVVGLTHVMITPEGIAYLIENRLMAKAKKISVSIKGIKDPPNSKNK